jgi:Flp pilus assembly protein TadD
VTYQEGLPDPNPPFDLFTDSNFFYPYTWRTNFPRTSAMQSWRALNLENEYLKCTVLPDLGGRLYSCLDKLSGRQMFYANPSIKKDWIALRGSWIAAGLELNFPVGHSWVTVSPVDWAVASNADGSGSIWVGATDRVEGMQWRAEFILRPGAALLEQRVTLYNRSNVRRRYYWWANAAVQVENSKTTFVLPTKLVALNGSDLMTWPVHKGVDLSVKGNQIGGGLSLFAFGSREEFMGVYHPDSRSGIVHYSPLSDAPGKKLWTWGSDGDNYARSALSDNGTTYIEIQAGVTGNQSSLEFLAPQQIRRFVEYWMPARDIGGISRANLHGVLNVRRVSDASGAPALFIEFNANRELPGATIRIWELDRVVFQETANLRPSAVYSTRLANPAPFGRYAVQLLDGAGGVLMTHLEGQYDADGTDKYSLGPQPSPDYSVQVSEEDFLAVSNYNEMHGNLLWAYSDCERGLAKFPASARLFKASGRLSVISNRFAAGIQRLSKARETLPDDPEIRYYLGVARAGLGDDSGARAEWEAILKDPAWGSAAGLNMTCLLARARDYSAALEVLRTSYGDRLDGVRAGAVEVTLLRLLERWEEAATRLAWWRAMDPADSVLRCEEYLEGQDDPALWHHLAADPERVLDVATHYIDMGLFLDALFVLDRHYPEVDPAESEPGAVGPQQYPLVLYYLAYAKEKAGIAARDDYKPASLFSTRYVFPNRAGSAAVLAAAIDRNPRDWTAHYLLGSLHMSFMMVDEAIAEWTRARSLRPGIPTLHRNLGRAWLDVKHDARTALPILEEGLKFDPTNADLQNALWRAQQQLK